MDEVWALLLDGPGTFEAARDTCECADIRHLLRKLPGAELAPCFGHAWVPIHRVADIDSTVAVTVLRTGKKKTVNVTVGELEKAEQNGLLDDKHSAYVLRDRVC